MRIAILTLVIFLLTATAASAYENDITIRSQMLTFNTGQYFTKLRGSDTILVDNPGIVQNALYSFNHDLSLEFWNDFNFHPAVFEDPSNFQACGSYPARLCIALNEFGGFVVNDRNLPDDFVGYGAYDRMRISRGRLFPTGQTRYNLLNQNMGMLSMNLNVPTQLTRTFVPSTMPTWYKRNTQFVPGYMTPYSSYSW